VLGNLYPQITIPPLTGPQEQREEVILRSASNEGLSFLQILLLPGGQGSFVSARWQFPYWPDGSFREKGLCT
jgi:hypothetical protein